MWHIWRSRVSNLILHGDPAHAYTHMWCLWGSWTPKLSKPGKHWHSTCHFISVITISRLRILTAWKWIEIMNIINLSLWQNISTKPAHINGWEIDEKSWYPYHTHQKLWNICLISALKVPNKHPCMLIYSHCFETVINCLAENVGVLVFFTGVASYTIIRSILSGTFTNVPPYTIVLTHTVTDFYKCATLYHYFTTHWYLESLLAYTLITVGL